MHCNRSAPIKGKACLYAWNQIPQFYILQNHPGICCSRRARGTAYPAPLHREVRRVPGSFFCLLFFAAKEK